LPEYSGACLAKLLSVKILFIVCENDAGANVSKVWSDF